MLTINELHLGGACTIKGEPYAVVKLNHVHMGRGGAVLHVKLRNLLTGNILEQTLKEGDRLEEADLEKRKANFLYMEGENYYFMDNESYEQFSFSESAIGNIKNFVKEGTDVEILYYNGKPVTVHLPPKVQLRVTEAPPSIKGDSAGSVTKRVTLETGYAVDAPLFIRENDEVIVNTELGKYVERANS